MEIVEGMEYTTPKRSHTWTQLPYHEPRWNQPPPLREMSSDHDVAGDRAAVCETPCAPPTAETAEEPQPKGTNAVSVVTTRGDLKKSP